MKAGPTEEAKRKNAALIESAKKVEEDLDD